MISVRSLLHVAFTRASIVRCARVAYHDFVLKSLHRIAHARTRYRKPDDSGVDLLSELRRAKAAVERFETRARRKQTRDEASVEI